MTESKGEKFVFSPLPQDSSFSSTCLVTSNDSEGVLSMILIFLHCGRVYEKIMEKMKAIGQANTGMKRKIGEWAKSVALKGNTNLEQGCVVNRGGFAGVLHRWGSEVTVKVCVLAERFGN